ncbi:hypothetical protein ACJX0J_034119, partial [Zea mays]
RYTIFKPNISHGSNSISPTMYFWHLCGITRMFMSTLTKFHDILELVFLFLSISCTCHMACTGSNTIPSLPVNLDSDAEHSVHDINSPEKNAPPIHKPKKALSSRWDKIRADTLNHVQMIVYMFTHFLFTKPVSIICLCHYDSCFHIFDRERFRGSELIAAM